jgi:hypothetical protein
MEQKNLGIRTARPPARPAQRGFRNWLHRMVRRLLRSVVFSAHNLVFNTLQILEEERVVAPGGVYSGYSRGGLTIVAPIPFSSECSLSTSARDSALNAR